jgi:hypothetical protein
MMNSETAIVEGKTVKVGDTVGFKSDVEQYGQITAIQRGRFGGYVLTLENPFGFSGDYIGGRKITSETADRCWVD